MYLEPFTFRWGSRQSLSRVRIKRENGVLTRRVMRAPSRKRNVILQEAKVEARSSDKSSSTYCN